MVKSECSADYLSGEIATCFELFEEGRHEEGWEEQDSGPEKNIGGVGAVVATCRPDKVSMQADTLLLRITEGVLAKRKASGGKKNQRLFYPNYLRDTKSQQGRGGKNT